MMASWSRCTDFNQVSIHFILQTAFFLVIWQSGQFGRMRPEFLTLCSERRLSGYLLLWTVCFFVILMATRSFIRLDACTICCRPSMSTMKMTHITIDVLARVCGLQCHCSPRHVSSSISSVNMWKFVSQKVTQVSPFCRSPTSFRI